jgi:tetratricopeptide (TPR) repeat protein
MAAPVLSERDLAALRSFARRIDPADAGAHNNLGVLYYQKGLVPEAVAAFARALELDPRMQVAQSNLEIAYRDSGHYDLRVAELQERLRRAPDDRDARWELGRTYAYLKQHAEAVAEFEALLARNPRDVAGMIQLGLARRAQGRVEDASEWFARACQADPDSAESGLRRRALSPRLRLRRHGPARRGAGRRQARDRAQSRILPGADQPHAHAPGR